ncbi:unnamed protein product [Rhizophagus irregularis]|nr:unnamed protein product [Rhizophagus irregularis]
MLAVDAIGRKRLIYKCNLSNSRSTCYRGEYTACTILLSNKHSYCPQIVQCSVISLMMPNDSKYSESVPRRFSK